MKKFTFVILHYITIDDTVKCVDSILEKCNKKNFEIVIVDNGSKNQTGEILEEKYKYNNKIHVILSKENLGFAKGNNLGFEYAKNILKTDFIIMLNNDVVVLQDDFCDIIEKEYETSKFAVLGPKIMLKDNSICEYEDELPSLKDIKRIKRKTKRLYVFNKIFLRYIIAVLIRIENIFNKLFKKEKKINTEIRKEDVVLNGCCLIFSKQYIDKFEGIDNRTFLYYEEYLLYIRLKSNNMKSIYNPKLMVLHNESVSTNKYIRNKRKKFDFKLRNELKSVDIVISEMKKKENLLKMNEIKEGKINFVTMFPRIENIHLVKDVGMIPYSMEKYYGYKSFIVVYKDEEYEYLEKDVKDLSKLYFPLKKFNSIINCFLFLLKNSKKIDILHLYHIGEKTTWISVFTYLFLNKRGFIYLHMDENTNNDIIDIFGIEEKSFKKLIKKIILKRIIYNNKNRNKILFGIQNNASLQNLKGKFPFDNIEYVSNAYENLNNDNIVVPKENIILFVGRVGSKQKRTDILLEGFKKASIEIPDWKLKIIGPIEESFKEYIEKFQKNNIELMERIEFVGPIYDRKKLIKEYSNAKIFCLTSDYESFGLVTIEALANSCVIVGSDIDATKEIINNGEYGNLFKCGDSDDFAEKLIKTCVDTQLLQHTICNSKKYVEDKYSYKKTLQPLNKWVIKKLGDQNE